MDELIPVWMIRMSRNTDMADSKIDAIKKKDA